MQEIKKKIDNVLEENDCYYITKIAEKPQNFLKRFHDDSIPIDLFCFLLGYPSCLCRDCCNDPIITKNEIEKQKNAILSVNLKDIKMFCSFGEHIKLLRILIHVEYVELVCISKSLKFPDSLKNLKCLLFSNGFIEFLPSLGEKMFPNLQVLDCSDNYVKDLKCISSAKRLRVLKCSGNCVESLHPLRNLILLEYVDCRDNEIIHENLSILRGLTNLQYLDLRGNQVKSAKGLPTNVKDADLHDNPCETSKNIHEISGSVHFKKLKNLIFLKNTFIGWISEYCLMSLYDYF